LRKFEKRWKTSTEDESERFIYNDQTGNLFFDLDRTERATTIQQVITDQFVSRKYFSIL
jgi:hypothetical protein